MTPEQLSDFYSQSSIYRQIPIEVQILRGTDSQFLYSATLAHAETCALDPDAVPDDAPGIHKQWLNNVLQTGLIRMDPVVYNIGPTGSWESTITIRAPKGQTGSWRFTADGVTKIAACRRAARRTTQFLTTVAEQSTDADAISEAFVLSPRRIARIA